MPVVQSFPFVIHIFFLLPMTCTSKKISAVERSVLALCFLGLTSFSHPIQGLAKAAKVSKKKARRQMSNFHFDKFISHRLASESLHSRQSVTTRIS